MAGTSPAMTKYINFDLDRFHDLILRSGVFAASRRMTVRAGWFETR